MKHLGFLGGALLTQGIVGLIVKTTIENYIPIILCLVGIWLIFESFSRLGVGET